MRRKYETMKGKRKKEGKLKKLGENSIKERKGRKKGRKKEVIQYGSKGKKERK